MAFDKESPISLEKIWLLLSESKTFVIVTITMTEI